MRFGSDHQGAQQDQGGAEPLEFGVPNLRMAGATHSHRIHVCYIMVTFTINIPQMLAYMPYMDPMGLGFPSKILSGNHHGDPWSI